MAEASRTVWADWVRRPPTCAICGKESHSNNPTGNNGTNSNKPAKSSASNAKGTQDERSRTRNPGNRSAARARNTRTRRRRGRLGGRVSITVDTSSEPVNLIWTEGDTHAQTFRLMAEPDEPMDLTGITMTAWARSTLGVPYSLPVYVTDPTTGIVQLHQPASLQPDVYDYDLQCQGGEWVASWVHGRIRVEKDVTP